MRPLLAIIYERETYKRCVYTSMNQGGTHAGHRAQGSGCSQDILGKLLTEMSIAEVMTRQAPRGPYAPPGGRPGAPGDKGIHAAGAPQVIGATLRTAVAALERRGELKRTDKFDAATQDKIAVFLIERQRTHSLANWASRLQNEWVGLQYVPRARLVEALKPLL